jgi:hypothetical protein
MKKINVLLLILTVLSLPISFSLCAIVGEVEIFQTLGLVRYIWIMLLFAPIPIGVFAFGIFLKKKKLGYKVNMILPSIVLAFLLVIGSYGFFFSDLVCYSDTYLKQAEQVMDYSLPEDLKVATLTEERYTLTYAKICNQEAREQFESGTLKEVPWKASLPTVIRGSLPMELQLEFMQCDYFLVYNVTANRFDAGPLYDRQWSFILVGYDTATAGFVIVSDYTVEFSS